VATTEKMYQFRRGSLPANIHYLCFDEAARMLAVTSDTDTIHIFKLSPGSAR
jgi:autophagy-related protein 18